MEISEDLRRLIFEAADLIRNNMLRSAIRCLIKVRLVVVVVSVVIDSENVII